MKNANGSVHKLSRKFHSTFVAIKIIGHTDRKIPFEKLYNIILTENICLETLKNFYSLISYSRFFT